MTHYHIVCLLSFLILVIIGIGIFFLRVAHVKNIWRKRFEEFNDCQFKFYHEFDDRNEYIVFNLNDGVTLWCDYDFGIRPDGVYGVKDLKLKGIGGDSGKLRLKIGQSIFPVMLKLEAFEAWAVTKGFKLSWDWTFQEYWTNMKEKLDNLKYLEHKSKEQGK